LRFDERGYAPAVALAGLGVLLMAVGHMLRIVDDNLADLGGDE
jgi:hypothetical protein